MAEKVLMIALSPTMEQGTIVSWQKKEGDSVTTGDLLCQVETDKATMDYESAQEGTLLKILVPEGSQASVGDPIAIVGNKDEDVSALVSEGSSQNKREAVPEKPAEKPAPKPSGKTEGELAKPAPEETTERPVKAEAERMASTGRGEQQENVERPAEPDRRGGSNERTREAGDGQFHTPGTIKASPLARRIARQKGIDLSFVQGTGTGGRIVREDVESFEPGKAGAPPVPRGAEAAAGREPERSREILEEKRIPLGGKRAVIARRLSESKFSAPHFYLRKAVFMEAVFRAREELNARRKEKVGLNAFVLKLCAEAIRRHPVINSSWAGDAIIRHGQIDIGLAVALPDGLIVPIVRDCGNKGIIEIDDELKDLIERARANRLMPEDFTGATFTVSNLGAYAVDEFTAIINPPGSAILAIGAAKKEPVVDEHDAVVVRQVMRLTLSCDHRVIDGAAGAEFMRDLAAIMENPMAALY